MMAKPGPSGTANTNIGVSSDSSQVKIDNTSSTSKEDTSTPSISKEDTSCNDTVDLSRTEFSSEQEILRRRRLQKFSPPPTE